MDTIFSSSESVLDRYRMHILVFLLALFAALTIGHPSLFVNDEWITVNQLAQLSEGHQVLLNEGKYGTFENGTVISQYFIVKQNFLAYSLMLPIISLPVLWLVNLLDSFFIFGILYLWTFLIIIIALFLNSYFPKFSRVGKFRWTNGLIIAAFLFFFLNLLFYRPFPVSGDDAFPEIMAIVVLNIILFSFMSIMVFQICKIILKDENFAFFGTVICLSSSSYLFWTNFCKDHILVAFLFTAIVLMVVSFLCLEKIPFLYGAFTVSGLLAWARPEIALPVCIALCMVWGYVYFFLRAFSTCRNRLTFLISPIFTIIGAIPFFVNNYIFTKNIFIPAWIFWKIETTSLKVVAGPGQNVSSDTIGSLINLITSSSNVQPVTLLPDLYGVLLNPQSGSIGLLLLVPVFFLSLFALPLLIIQGVTFSQSEKKILIGLILLALGVFFAYLRGITGLNTSPGILPDMRYLSPIYLPLNIIGILIINKIPRLFERPLEYLKNMILMWGVLIPPSMIALVYYYPAPEIWSDLYPPLNAIISVGTFILIAVCVLCLIGHAAFGISQSYTKYFMAFLLAVPFIWQIEASLLARLYGIGLGGYSFWIPIVRFYFVGIF